MSIAKLAFSIEKWKKYNANSAICNLQFAMFFLVFSKQRYDLKLVHIDQPFIRDL